MLFSDLQSAILTRIESDTAYLAEPGKAVTVLAENALDLLSEYEKAISKLGMAVIISTPRVTPTERVDLANVSVSIAICEHVSLNRATSGTQKPAIDVGAGIMAMLRNWTPDENVWAPFLFLDFARVGQDETSGCDLWSIDFQTQTMLDAA